MTDANTKEQAYGELFTTRQDAAKWDDLYRDTSTLFNHNMAERRDRICDIVFRRYTPDDSILDLGCGAGVVMEQLLEKGYRVNGVDRSADMLDLSRKRLARFPADHYALKEATCGSLPFADGQFDVVLCVGMFGYIDDVVGALLEIRRVLKPGGLLVMSVRNQYNNVLRDPVKTLRVALDKFLGRFRKAAGTGGQGVSAPAAPASQPGRPPQFKIDIHQRPGPLLAGVGRCGYRLEFFSGFGFGPLAIADRRLFPHSWNIRLSDFLGRAFDRLSLQKLSRAVGDVSIYGFVKTGA